MRLQYIICHSRVLLGGGSGPVYTIIYYSTIYYSRVLSMKYQWNIYKNIYKIEFIGKSCKIPIICQLLLNKYSVQIK